MPEFINQSFEIPDGVAATLLSVNAEPFSLADEQTLLLAIDGGSQQAVLFETGSRGSVLSGATETFPLVDGQTLDVEVDGAPAQTATFNTADFVAIGAATASEVAAVILTDVTGVFVTVESGAIRITAATKGASGSVEVTGGTANATLLFPAGNNPGTDFFVDITMATAAEVAARINAQATGVTASDSAGQVLLTSDTVGDDSSVRCDGGSANIALDFSTIEASGTTQLGTAQGWTLAAVSAAFEIATFDTTFPESYEDFEEEWGTGTPSGELVAAVFDSTTPQQFEDFEEEWDNGPLTLGAVEAASFGTGLETAETFESEWGQAPAPSFLFGPNEGFEAGWGQGATPTFDPAEFDGATMSSAETFEFTTTIQDIVSINAPETGELFQIIINGEPAVATGGASSPATATALAAAVNNLSQPVTATPNGSDVEIEADNPGEPFVTSCVAPSTNPSACTLTFPDPTIQWTGRSFFCI